MHYIAQSLVAINDRCAFLRWDPVTDHDLAGYNVYMSLQTPDNFVKVNTKLVESPWYFTPILRPDITYFFRVTSVDRGGNESAPSDAIEFRLSDYRADPNLVILNPPATVLLKSGTKRTETCYEDFMTRLRWVDPYLIGRTNVQVPASGFIVKLVPAANFTTVFTWGG